jgi:hypothetical protein
LEKEGGGGRLREKERGEHEEIRICKGEEEIKEAEGR